MSSDISPPTLAAVIADLRRELAIAQAEGAAEPIRFRVKPVEIELQVAITQGAEANAGIKFWVVEAGGKFSDSNQITHKVTLTLEPFGADDAEIDISHLSRNPD